MNQNIVYVYSIWAPVCNRYLQAISVRGTGISSGDILHPHHGDYIQMFSHSDFGRTLKNMNFFFGNFLLLREMWRPNIMPETWQIF